MPSCYFIIGLLVFWLIPQSFNPPPIERQIEIISQLIETANQIEVLYNFNCNRNSSLILGELKFSRLLWGESPENIWFINSWLRLITCFSIKRNGS